MPNPKDVCSRGFQEALSASDSDCESLLESLSLPEEDEESDCTTATSVDLVAWPMHRCQVAGNV